MSTTTEYFVATSSLKQIFKCTFQSKDQAKRRAKEWALQMADNGKHERVLVYERTTTVRKSNLRLQRSVEDRPVWEFYWYIADNGQLELDQGAV